ncbi:unnamed protein product [Haemonchus placei]|uniref:Glutamyl-tRNA(Gln) amidotransferase subunit A, mitochondrial n=1 Tax=Haemonchus placei TaxID=6290 RepID=A0A0N4WF06_HAEPC|nr:unnamed protein product [Haemonchus placei]
MQRIEAAIECAIKSRKYNALVTETFELARSQAKSAIEKGLTPIPVVVKDCFAVAGYPMTCASRMLENYVPPYTATVVQRLINKGGCVIGKANMDEFCMGTSSALGHFGPVKSGLTEDVENDWIVPGGSSGGSAVAVHLGMADIGLGSDTGGSSRNPAAFNGLFGLKPTYGVLSRHGLVPLVNSMDAPSIICKTAKKCWEFLGSMTGIDQHDSTTVELPSTSRKSDLKGLRIGVPKEYYNEFLTDDAWKVWNHAANLLQQQGAIIEHVSLPHTKYSLLCYQVLSAADIVSNMARYVGIGFGHRSDKETSTFDLYASTRTEALNSVVKARIMAGNYFLMREYRKEFYDRALKVRRVIAAEMYDVLKRVDLLLTPTATGAAPRFSDHYKGFYKREDHDDFYTQPTNLAGLPAISVPCGSSSDDLPIGVQLIGNLLQDRLVCDVGQQLYDAAEDNGGT